MENFSRPFSLLRNFSNKILDNKYLKTNNLTSEQYYNLNYNIPLYPYNFRPTNIGFNYQKILPYDFDNNCGYFR